METREIKIKRLLYQSWYRGCKETDRILGYFCKEYISDMSDDEITLLEAIMDESDSDIYNWVSLKTPLPDNYKNNKIMTKIMEFDLSSVKKL